jgi:hypothetical protein
MDVVGDCGAEPIVDRRVVLEVVDGCIQRDGSAGDLRDLRVTEDADDPTGAITQTNKIAYV